MDGNAVVACEGFHPLLGFTSPLGQSLLGNGINPVHVAEEMDDVLRARKQRQVALDHDAVQTVVYKSLQAAKQLMKVSIGPLR